TTVTGLAVPSIEARIASVVGLRPDVKRVPLFGLGCLAGAAGLARLHDFMLGWPDAVGILLSVELCSLTLQRDDPSMANLVASGLFGDGAAAAVVVGAHRSEPGPEIIASRSHLYPDTGRAMGWDFGAGGLKVVLGAEVPDLVTMYLADDVKGLLTDHRLHVGDIETWVAHPGGPKVLRAIERALQLPADALAVTWRSLAAIGNLSSASVLHVLRDTLDERTPRSGSPGLMLAMGPGFCAELVLLRW
ncbi:MAG: type III polyketide synthase, partial [Nocardioidaceae bacterium]|nr:type III polyketide synthase [Nocardioidaceae bacterium]